MITLSRATLRLVTESDRPPVEPPRFRNAVRRPVDSVRWLATRDAIQKRRSNLQQIAERLRHAELPQPLTFYPSGPTALPEMSGNAGFSAEPSARKAIEQWVAWVYHRFIHLPVDPIERFFMVQQLLMFGVVGFGLLGLVLYQVATNGPEIATDVAALLTRIFPAGGAARPV